MSTPTTVFKFCTAVGGIAILQNRSLFITSPLDLNDPFEMRPAWTDEHAQRHHEDQVRRNNMMAGTPLLAPMQDGTVCRIGTMPLLEAQALGPVEHQLGIADMHNKRVFRLLHKHYRVLSFSTGILDIEKSHDVSDEHSTLMWSHYAESFQGICLAFDSTKFENGIKTGGFPVYYSPTRRSLPASFYDFFQSVTAEKVEFGGVRFEADSDSGLLMMAHNREERLRDDFISFLTHKSPAWKYEKEVRMIYDLPTIRASQHYADPKFPCEHCNKEKKSWQDCKGPTYRDALRVPPEAMLAVILGTDISKTDVMAILSALDSPDLAHVRVYWSSLHADRYVLQYNRDDQDTGERYSLFMQEQRERQNAEAKGHVRYEPGVTCYIAAKKTVNYGTVYSFPG